MAFTSTDLTNVETAITKLATGARVTSCTIDGDEVQYHRADLMDLLKLRDLIQSELNTASSTDTSNKGRARKAVTSKGY